MVSDDLPADPQAEEEPGDPTANTPELEPADSPAMARLRAGTRLINARPAWMR
jgi:hypothetical protein